jgi:hypothetical protein
MTIPVGKVTQGDIKGTLGITGEIPDPVSLYYPRGFLQLLPWRINFEELTQGVRPSNDRTHF